MKTSAATTDPDAVELGMQLAQCFVPGLVLVAHSLSADAQIEFFRAFLACLSGAAQQAIGHSATVDALHYVADLRAVDGARGVH